MTLREAMRATYPVKVYQVIGIAGLLLVIVFGGIGGCAQYVSDQREQSRRDTELALYNASVAQFENARDERTRCEQRVTGRLDVRNAFIGQTDLIKDLFAIGRQLGGEVPAAFTDRINETYADIDETYPILTLDDCPPVPVPPTPPEE